MLTIISHMNYYLFLLSELAIVCSFVLSLNTLSLLFVVHVSFCVFFAIIVVAIDIGTALDSVFNFFACICCETVSITFLCSTFDVVVLGLVEL